MTDFAMFAFYIMFAAMALVVAPVMMVPGMRMRTKLLVCSFVFFILVPGGLFLYLYLGAPKMAAIG